MIDKDLVVKVIISGLIYVYQNVINSRNGLMTGIPEYPDHTKLGFNQ